MTFLAPEDKRNGTERQACLLQTAAHERILRHLLNENEQIQTHPVEPDTYNAALVQKWLPGLCSLVLRDISHKSDESGATRDE